MTFHPQIDATLVRRLVDTQFPEWKSLLIRPVAHSGWDNRTFHLGEKMLVRLPSAAHYSGQVEKEQYWLPKLAPFLPFQIPQPLAIGEPGEGYPWKWSVYRWLEGDTAAVGRVSDLNLFASDVALFLKALHSIDSTNGPPPGPHNFYRGGSLRTYEEETRQAIAALKGQLDVETATEVWETALRTEWDRKPVWIHGDMSAGNLLVKEGRLFAVIDFGQLGVGDPACDLSIAWTFLEKENRETFRETLILDPHTWARGRAWTLWKALIYLVNGLKNINFESAHSWRILGEVLADHKLEKERG